MTRSSSLLFLAIAVLIPAASIVAGKPNRKSDQNRLTVSGFSSDRLQPSQTKTPIVKLAAAPVVKLAAAPVVKRAEESQTKPQEKPIAKKPPSARSSKIRLLDSEILPVVNTNHVEEPQSREIEPLTFEDPQAVAAETLERAPPVFRNAAAFHDEPVITVVQPIEPVVAGPRESVSEYPAEGCKDCRSGSGKYHLGDFHKRYGGYHRTYRERPFGTYVCMALRRQIGAGLADSMMLYDYDFHHGAASAELTSRGIYQLKKFAHRSRISGLPIVIEMALGKSELDQARRESVFDALKVLDPTATEDWVVVGTPNVAGLNGDDAILIDQTRLLQTESRGIHAPADTGGIDSGGSSE